MGGHGDRHRSITETPTRRQQLPGQRQRDAQHVGRVTVDTVDEPAAVAVDGQRAGDGQRFAGGDVGVHLRGRRPAHPDHRRSGCRRRGQHAPSAIRLHGMPGEQHAVPAGHLPPASRRLLARRRACPAARRRSAASSRSRRQPGRRPGCRAGRRPAVAGTTASALASASARIRLGGLRVGRPREHRVLVDPGHRDERVETGGAQHAEPGRGRGGEQHGRHRGSPDAHQPCRRTAAGRRAGAPGPPTPMPARLWRSRPGGRSPRRALQGRSSTSGRVLLVPLPCIVAVRLSSHAVPRALTAGCSRASSAAGSAASRPASAARW